MTDEGLLMAPTSAATRKGAGLVLFFFEPYFFLLKKKYTRVFADKKNMRENLFMGKNLGHAKFFPGNVFGGCLLYPIVR